MRLLHPNAKRAKTAAPASAVRGMGSFLLAPQYARHWSGLATRSPRTAAVAREGSRRQPVQARSRATTAAILEAAARVFAEHGYAAGTTNRIAERAGVSVGSLYEYY